MEKNLRTALMASAVLHAAVVVPLLTFPLMKHPVKKEMVVDYVILKQALKIENPAMDVALKVPETPKVELKPKVKAAPAPNAPIAKIDQNKDAPRELAQKQQRIKTTKDYINYYQLLREKIRQKVKRNYRNSYNEGEIHLNFTLNANGSLAACDIDRATSFGDTKLAELAISSVRQASPFPPFPKALSVPTMTFTVTVVFKKERP